MEIKNKRTQLTRFKLPEVRCFWCNRLLFRGIVENVEIKCPRCAAIQHICSCKQEPPVHSRSQEERVRQSR